MRCSPYTEHLTSLAHRQSISAMALSGRVARLALLEPSSTRGNCNLRRSLRFNEKTLGVLGLVSLAARSQQLVANQCALGLALAFCGELLLPTSALTRSASSCGTSAGTASQESACSHVLPLKGEYTSRIFAALQFWRMTSNICCLLCNGSLCPITATANLWCLHASVTSC